MTDDPVIQLLARVGRPMRVCDVTYFTGTSLVALEDLERRGLVSIRGRRIELAGA